MTTNATPVPVTKTVVLRDGATITRYWSATLRCYVTIPNDRDA